jgi:predicted HicB family RNase H-like nuclease
MTKPPKSSSLKISTELHQRLKIEAAQKGTKMQTLVERTLEKSLPPRKKKEVAL